MLALSCSYMNYDWGKVGHYSEVFGLLDQNKTLPDDEPYAELWMGEHPNCPSRVHSEQYQFLSELIRNNAFCLGNSDPGDNVNLSFLFKVLSIRRALSIQVHPTKSQAQKLHNTYPDIYKDPNHKPELAIALTDFEALIGFRFLDQIRWFFQNVPHLSKFLPHDFDDFLLSSCKHPRYWNDENLTLKKLYTFVMTASQEKVTELTALIYEALKNPPVDMYLRPGDMSVIDIEELRSVFKLYTRLYDQFPGDVGCISVFFLHYIILKPSEAIYLDAGTIHAYISGDCVECMASSDNVVRAGLTTKFKDVETLLDIVNFRPHRIEDLRFKPSQFDVMTSNAKVCTCLLEYSPPIEDFAVDRFFAKMCTGNFTLCPVASASIILIVTGEGQIVRRDHQNRHDIKILPFKRGSVFFVYAAETVQIRTTEDCNFPSQEVLIFRARSNFKRLL